MITTSARSAAAALLVLALSVGCGGDEQESPSDPSPGVDATSGLSSTASLSAALADLDLGTVSAPTGPELPEPFGTCAEPAALDLPPGPESDAYGGATLRLVVMCDAFGSSLEVLQYATADVATAFFDGVLRLSNPNIVTEEPPGDGAPAGTRCLRVDDGSAVSYKCYASAERFTVVAVGLASVADASAGIVAGLAWLDELAMQTSDG